MHRLDSSTLATLMAPMYCQRRPLAAVTGMARRDHLDQPVVTAQRGPDGRPWCGQHARLVPPDHQAVLVACGDGCVLIGPGESELDGNSFRTEKRGSGRLSQVGEIR